MRNTKSSVMTYGAAMTAVYILLFLIVIFVPFIGIFAYIFTPLPFVAVVLRFGIKSGLVMAFASLIVSFILLPAAGFMTIITASVGLAMGYWYAKDKGAFSPVVAGILAYLVNYLLGIIILYTLFDTNIIQWVQQAWIEQLNATEGISDFLQIPLDEERLSLYKEYIDTITYTFPAIMILSSIVIASLHHKISRSVLTRIGMKIPAFPPFREWKLPKSILFYYIITLSLLLFNIVEEGNFLFVMLLNLHPILEMLVFIQGLSVVAYFGHVKRIGKALPIFTVVLTLFIPLITMFVRMIGIFELGIGIRAKIKTKD